MRCFRARQITSSLTRQHRARARQKLGYSVVRGWQTDPPNPLHDGGARQRLWRRIGPGEFACRGAITDGDGPGGSDPDADCGGDIDLHPATRAWRASSGRAVQSAAHEDRVGLQGHRTGRYGGRVSVSWTRRRADHADGLLRFPLNGMPRSRVDRRTCSH